MTGVELIMYESFQDLTGTRSTVEELIAGISKFSRDSVLWTCSFIGTAMQLGDQSDQSHSTYGFLLDHFFDNSLAARFKISNFQADRRIVFHRRQLLFLAKLAILYSPISGPLRASTNTKHFGLLLLKANDHFHHDLISDPNGLAYDKADYERFLAELLASEEFGHKSIAYLLARSHKMICTIAPKLTAHPDFVDLEALFLESSGLTMPVFEALVFGTTTRFGKSFAEHILSTPDDLPLRDQTFIHSQIPRKQVGLFLRHVSSGPEQLKQELEKRLTAPNDITIFRSYPFTTQWFNVPSPHIYLGFLLMDQYCLLEKVATGPYFAGIRKHKDSFTRFWGAVFEEYVSEMLTAACCDTSSNFIPNPRVPGDDSKQLCDGIIVAGDQLILIECKGSIFRADNKYQGDPILLGKEIADKLVFSEKEKKKKAVHQLASAIKTLFAEVERPKVEGCDLSKIRKCYLLVVTYDAIGGAIAMSSYLNLFLQEQIGNSNFPQLEVRPLFCVDIESLESAASAFGRQNLATILDRWLSFSPLLSMPLATVRFPDLLPARNAWLMEEWKCRCASFSAQLFSQEHIAAHSTVKTRRASNLP